METNETLDQRQYLTFFLAGEEYAVGIMKVKEILEYDTVTRVPKTPAWVRGVFNLRSSVVPVIDLALKFGQPETAITRTTCIIIVEANLDSTASVMGVLADSVSQVLDLSPQDIEPPPVFGTQVKVDYLQGMAKLGKKFALVLDIDKVLSTSELLQIADLKLEQEKAGDAEGEDAIPTPSAGPDAEAAAL
ncbi:MAG TPA: chemotaxis protein CheW [Candidatus Limnocylindrales bacterium]|nr:chemotaxis protein CheW [Candidatus Limnocylindrales bacterium]